MKSITDTNTEKTLLSFSEWKKLKEAELSSTENEYFTESKQITNNSYQSRAKYNKIRNEYNHAGNNIICNTYNERNEVITSYNNIPLSNINANDSNFSSDSFPNGYEFANNQFFNSLPPAATPLPLPLLEIPQSIANPPPLMGFGWIPPKRHYDPLKKYEKGFKVGTNEFGNKKVPLSQRKEIVEKPQMEAEMEATTSTGTNISAISTITHNTTLAPPLIGKKKLKKMQQVAAAKNKPTPVALKDAGEWVIKPPVPPTLDTDCNLTLEEKQRMWKEYRQAMKPYKNREFANAKRTVQRLSKLDKNTMDEISIERLRKAEAIVNGHKAMLEQKANSRYLRSLTNAEVGPNGEVSPTKVEIYVRKTNANQYKRAAHTTWRPVPVPPPPAPSNHITLAAIASLGATEPTEVPQYTYGYGFGYEQHFIAAPESYEFSSGNIHI